MDQKDDGERGGGVGRRIGRNQKHMSREVDKSLREKPAGVLSRTSQHNKLHSKARLQDCDDLTMCMRACMNVFDLNQILSG